MAAYALPVCGHGNTGSCPHDWLCQVRLRSNTVPGFTAKPDAWQTHSVYACDANVDSWRRQVAPRMRRRGYETRVVPAESFCHAS